MLQATASTKPCEVCKKPFKRFSTFQTVCRTVKCAVRQPAVALKKRKEAAKTTPKLKAEAWAAMSKWVRHRDLSADYGCIDCGKPFEPNKPGGSVDAGHFLPRSTHPHLKWDERNVFAQMKHCNRPGGTTHHAFRAGVVERIGEEATAALEADKTPRRYRADDYRRIRDEYRNRLKGKS